MTSIGWTRSSRVARTRPRSFVRAGALVGGPVLPCREFAFGVGPRLGSARLLVDAARTGRVVCARAGHRPQIVFRGPSSKARRSRRRGSLEPRRCESAPPRPGRPGRRGYSSIAARPRPWPVRRLGSRPRPRVHLWPHHRALVLGPSSPPPPGLGATCRNAVPVSTMLPAALAHIRPRHGRGSPPGDVATRLRRRPTAYPRALAARADRSAVVGLRSRRPGWPRVNVGVQQLVSFALLSRG